MISPKIEIINHFDELINRVDIEFEECLGKYNEEQVLGKIRCIEKSEMNKIQTVDLWSESTKVVDYLNQVRMTTIEELKKAQEETLEYYKLNSSQFKDITDENKIEELRSKLFGEKFYFQVRNKGANEPWIYNLYTFVTDFYMSQSDINLFEDYINFEPIRIKPIFDEKMVLIKLLYGIFRECLKTEKYPSHLICVNKRETLSIKKLYCQDKERGVKLTSIDSLIDLSNLEELKIYNIDKSGKVQIDSLPSLRKIDICITSIEQLSVRNLKSLKTLLLSVEKEINESLISIKIFDDLTNIEDLYINGTFSNLNLDKLDSLKRLTLYGKINSNDFNLSLCKNLHDLWINLSNIGNDHISKLFDGRIFPNLQSMEISSSIISKLEKKIFCGFPSLQILEITYNKELRSIDNDVFESLNNLVVLKLKYSNIEKIDHRTFSAALIQLQTLDLRSNKIECIEENIFSNLKNLTHLDLSYNLFSTLNPQSFFGLGNLETLNLSNNNLTDFDIRILDNLGKIERVILYSNSISNKDEVRKKVKDINIHI